jgi:RuvA, C-terminal domain
MHLTDLSDEELVSRLSALCLEGHALTARMIVHLIEVEDRRLDLRAACTSMFDFCQRRLGMSEGAAFRRINAARLVKRFPSLLARIERGELHLSTLVLLRRHLTESNVEELAEAVVGKTQRQVEELVARLAPRRDVPSEIVPLGGASRDVAPPFLFAGPDIGVNANAATPASAPAATRIRACARIEPLSEARYKVQLTAGSELKAKLERACDLMRHRNPSGDLAPVLEAAMDLLLAKLEKERLGKVKTPRAAKAKSPKPSEARGIPVAVRRAVFERDGEQCTFRDIAGERCPSRGHLELDHIEPRALGGLDEASNLRVRCRAHNRLYAEQVFGKDVVARQIDFRQRKSAVSAASAVPPCAAAPPAPRILEVALRGLHNMGFPKTEARRALDSVSQRGESLAVQDLLRNAIAALT